MMQAIQTCQREAVKCSPSEKGCRYRKTHAAYRVRYYPWSQGSIIPVDKGRGATVVSTRKEIFFFFNQLYVVPKLPL